MTAPVEMVQSDKSAWTMSFVMPSKYNMETLPIPNDPRISIRKINHRKTAVFKTSGWHSKEKLEKHAQNLQVW